MDRAEPIGVQGTFRPCRAVGSGKQSPLRDAGCQPLHETVEREVAAAVQFAARQDIQREVVIEHAALGIERQSRKRSVVQAAGQLLERSPVHVFLRRSHKSYSGSGTFCGGGGGGARVGSGWSPMNFGW